MTDAIVVMWARQIKLYTRSKHRMIGSLAQPLLFLITFGFGFSPIFKRAGEGNYIQFLVPGIVCMTLLFSSVMNGMSLIWDKQFGFLKETLVAPVPRSHLLIGRCLGGATTSTLQGIIVLTLSFFMGYRPENWLLLPFAILLMFLIALLLTLLGNVIATQISDMQAFPTIMNFLVMPMFFLSGALFPTEHLPTALKVLTQINPVSYSVQLLQYPLGREPECSILLNLGITMLFIAILLVLGTKLFNQMEA